MLGSSVRLGLALLLLVPTAACSESTDLTVVVRDGATTTWRLTCDPAAGDHPDPAAACQSLADHGTTALPAVPPGRACTQIYGGPQQARITGTWNGEPVSSTLSRVNGCEISRWDALAGLLPKAGT